MRKAFLFLLGALVAVLYGANLDDALFWLGVAAFVTGSIFGAFLGNHFKKMIQ